MAILDDVKSALNVIGDYADNTLALHIETVESYLLNAGVDADVVSGDASKGAIIRGVADLWNVNSGGVDFSPAFRDMVIQLAVHDQEEQTNGGE